MQYQGPSAVDLDNIHALNARFLKLLADAGCAGVPRTALSETQQARLGLAPFLLFSFRETEEDFWKQLLSADGQLDLIGAASPPDPATRELQVAGLSFLWQLAQRNPYVVRLVSGAPVSWCEGVAGLTLVGLLSRTADRGDILVPRFRHRAPVWQRLMKSGTSRKVTMRDLSHRSALHAMLTTARPVSYERLQAAAARLPAPRHRGAP